MADEKPDPQLSQHYAELDREEPPPELDTAILAAARRAAEARPAALVAPTGRRRWYFPVAAAATIGLAAALTLQFERQQTDPEASVAAVEQPKEVMEPKVAAARDSMNRAEVQSAPVPRADVRNRALAAKVQSPEAELERIARLRDERRDEEAERAFEEFRRRYPAYRIPETMLERLAKRPAPATVE